MTTNTVKFHRVLRTTPEKIYRAFTDADAWTRWLPPNGFTAKVHQMDAKVGGTYKMSFTNFTTGHSHSFGGKYLELVPHSRIRRPESAGGNANDCNAEEGFLRNRGEHRAGRHAGCHSSRSLLPRLAGITFISGETCRTGNSQLKTH